MPLGMLGPGDGIAAERVAAIPSPAEGLGYVPYPGTLNVLLRSRMFLYEPGWRVNVQVGGENFDCLFWPILVDGIEGHAVAWSDRRGDAFLSIEAIAPMNLREALALGECSQVMIERRVR